MSEERGNLAVLLHIQVQVSLW